MYDYRYSPMHLDCVQRYRNRPEVLTALHQALAALALQPFSNPKQRACEENLL